MLHARLSPGWAEKLAQAAYLAAKQRDRPRPLARRLHLLALSQLAEPLPVPALLPPLAAGMQHKQGRAA